MGARRNAGRAELLEIGNTEPGAGRWYLTDLIRKNSPQEIEDTVRRFMVL